MAGIIRHDAVTHAEVSAALAKDYTKITNLEDDLNITAKHLTAPKVWTGEGADKFLYKHGVLMNDVAALAASVKALDDLRQGAYEGFQGADRKVARMWQ